MKNSFTLVQAIARQTFRKVNADLYSWFEGRLSALAKSHNLLLADGSREASIRETVTAAVEGHVDVSSETIQMSGPDLVLDAELTLALSLVFHELATNALKYGALHRRMVSSPGHPPTGP